MACCVVEHTLMTTQPIFFPPLWPFDKLAGPANCPPVVREDRVTLNYSIGTMSNKPDLVPLAWVWPLHGFCIALGVMIRRPLEPPTPFFLLRFLPTGARLPPLRLPIRSSFSSDFFLACHKAIAISSQAGRTMGETGVPHAPSSSQASASCHLSCRM